MYKKSVLGLAILAAGLLVWSCGDGSVDSLNDNELIMISRFPSTIDYDMLDSVVEACKKDNACWEKAKKTGEIYKGDYTKVLRDSSGDIIVVEGDSAYVWKDGKKLPVFDIPTNNSGDEDDESSSSTATSGSSSKSSGSGFEDGGYTDDGTGQGPGGGSGTSAIHVDRSSSSKKTGTSSSVDLSFLSSSSREEVEMSFINDDPEGSSSSRGALSAGSEDSGGGNSGVVLKCGNKSISGTCKLQNDSLDYAYVGKTITYVYIPDAGTCTDESAASWDIQHEDATPQTHDGGFSLGVVYSSPGIKSLATVFIDNKPIYCEQVSLSTCPAQNGYSCKMTLLSASNNVRYGKLQPAGQVSYKWELTKTGCDDVTKIVWSGADPVSNDGKSYSATKSFTSATTATVSVKVTAKGSTTTVPCESAVVVSEEHNLPQCNVASFKSYIGESVSVTPSSTTGCDYDSQMCSYSLREGSATGQEIVGDEGPYKVGKLKSFNGKTTVGEVAYTLVLENYKGKGNCNFTVTYTDTVFVSSPNIAYGAGKKYLISVGSNTNKFVCMSNSLDNSGTVIGELNGVELKAVKDEWAAHDNFLYTLNSGEEGNFFVINSDAPSDLNCKISW